MSTYPLDKVELHLTDTRLKYCGHLVITDSFLWPWGNSLHFLKIQLRLVRTSVNVDHKHFFLAQKLYFLTYFVVNCVLLY